MFTRRVASNAFRIASAGVMPTPVATSARLSKAVAVLNGDVKGPQTKQGRTVSYSTAAWSLRVQSPATFAQIAVEPDGSSGAG